VLGTGTRVSYLRFQMYLSKKKGNLDISLGGYLFRPAFSLMDRLLAYYFLLSDIVCGVSFSLSILDQVPLSFTVFAL